LRGEIRRSGEFECQYLVDFLAKGLEKRDRMEEAQIIRDLGTSEQQARLLIDEGVIAEAMKMIKKIIKRALQEELSKSRPRKV
jgi:hypothetical protein